MDALEKEIQAIIDSDEVTEEASTDTDESIEEAYKTKDQVKAEVDELLSTMKRSELVDAQDKLTPQPEEEVQEADAPDEGGDAKSVPVEDDPNDDDKVFLDRSSSQDNVCHYILPALTQPNDERCRLPHSAQSNFQHRQYRRR